MILLFIDVQLQNCFIFNLKTQILLVLKKLED